MTSSSISDLSSLSALKDEGVDNVLVGDVHVDVSFFLFLTTNEFDGCDEDEGR